MIFCNTQQFRIQNYYLKEIFNNDLSNYQTDLYVAEKLESPGKQIVVISPGCNFTYQK